MSKNKAKKAKHQQKEQHEKAKAPPASAAPAVASAPAVNANKTLQFLSPEVVPFLLTPPEQSRCLPPIFINEDPQIVPDPWAVLGLAPNTSDPTAIRNAWREHIIASPPEQDPEGAARLTAARDRLLDEARWAERLLGSLHVPDPDAWDLPARFDLWDAGLMDARTRLLGQALLYALLEQDLA